jgi:hypothetical protein
MTAAMEHDGRGMSELRGCSQGQVVANSKHRNGTPTRRSVLGIAGALLAGSSLTDRLKPQARAHDASNPLRAHRRRANRLTATQIGRYAEWPTCRSPAARSARPGTRARSGTCPPCPAGHRRRRRCPGGCSGPAHHGERRQSRPTRRRRRRPPCSPGRCQPAHQRPRPHARHDPGASEHQAPRRPRHP